MCLSIPAEVIEVNGDMARVSIGGTIYDASLQLVENIKPGDYILLHTGFAIEKLDREEALSTLELFRELDELERPPDPDQQ
ncbi:MAG TPA: HypC/HybG/HupF family hydrogenase formation chaperone [Cyclobacteriaceae bacterium]|nr:HypC/HybG/HupF family hydrogenase formation chaperone [Cyclobacteriaceae bacterium]